MVGNTDMHLKACKLILQKKGTHTSLFYTCKGSLKLQKQGKQTNTSKMLKTD